MIARMGKNGVITLEAQNGAEVVALKHWVQENRVLALAVDTDGAEPHYRGTAIEVKAE